MNQERQEQEPSRQYQELGYLKDELNKILIMHSEFSHKTINMVLLVWASVCVIIGKDGVKLTEIRLENIPQYFMLAVVLFISNLILYYTAQRYYNNTVSLSKISAYIAVFYERRPSKAVKVGNNFSWELTNFENARNAFKRSAEYSVLTLISIVMMCIFLIPLVINIVIMCEDKTTICVDKTIVSIVSFIVFFIYVICIGISIYWLHKIPEYTYLRDDHKIKAEYMKTFLQYALMTEHDTKESLNEKFGEGFWQDVMGCKS